MATDERLMALKKAYADIILNTAKEAAVRIMSSERKAQRFERELQVAKDEALRMLLRLKQMMDSKITQAELASLCQQRKIDELEAQLHEAEDIVKDLREELREVQSELEQVRNDRLHYPDEYHDVAEGEIPEENRFHTSETVIFPPLGSEFECAAAVDSRNANYIHRNECHKLYSAATGLGNSYIGCPDLPSILLRSKEPELYRNGCTQRIRASEGNLLDRELSLSGQNKMKDETSAEENERGKEIFTASTYGTENLRNVKKKVVESDSQLGNWQHIQSFGGKKKRANRYRKNRIASRKIPDQDFSANGTPEVSSINTHPILVGNDAHSDGNALQITQILSAEKAQSRQQPCCAEVSKYESEPVESFTVSEPINGQKATEKLVHAGQEIRSTESSVIPVGETYIEKVHLLLPKSESNESDVANGASSQPSNKRIIKYTFQRKRKKESLSGSDRTILLEDKTSERRTLNTQNSPVEQGKSNLVIESTRDNLRLSQVAHQLISLSEKKW